MLESFCAPREDAGDAAVDLSPINARTIAPAGYLLREGQETRHALLIVEGLAHRHKIVARGARQIIGLCVPGDLIDPHLAFTDRMDHCVQALTPCRVVGIPLTDLRAHIRTDAEFSRGLWLRSLIETAINREWQANLGRRNALSRLAHLICELRYRLGGGEPADGEALSMALTQNHLADMLGLTSVHINRVLREMEERELVRREKRQIVVLSWDALRRIADFNPRYLHLDARAALPPILPDRHEVLPAAA